jgi:hypothetical protein
MQSSKTTYQTKFPIFPTRHPFGVSLQKQVAGSMHEVMNSSCQFHLIACVADFSFYKNNKSLIIYCSLDLIVLLEKTVVIYL